MKRTQGTPTESFWPITETERLHVKYVEEPIRKIPDLANHTATLTQEMLQ